MPISSIFQGNSQSVPGNTPSSQREVVNVYEDTTDVRTNHDIPLLFFATSLKGFRAMITVNVTVNVDADPNPNLSETFEILGTNDGTSWSISQTSIANTNGAANITFDITSAGQIRYSSTSTTGFTKRTLAWSVLAL
ncbi:hypothetical protein EBR25_13135 [bacterium]|nr:hypothetical protein [bacterium]